MFQPVFYFCFSLIWINLKIEFNIKSRVQKLWSLLLYCIVFHTISHALKKTSVCLKFSDFLGKLAQLMLEKDLSHKSESKFCFWALIFVFRNLIDFSKNQKVPFIYIVIKQIAKLVVFVQCKLVLKIQCLR